MIYTLDHGPAHIHFVGPDGRAKAWLNCPNGPLQLDDAIGVDAKMLRQLVETATPEIQKFCKAWEKIHGRS
jgi:hypothetical protein